MSKDLPLQYKIIEKIQTVIKEGLYQNKSRIPNLPKNSKFYQQFKDHNKSSLGYKIFSNFRIRNNKPEGLRLTRLGNELLKRNFDFYEYNHSTTPTPKIYLFLDQKMQWPYYFTKKKMVMYNQEDAAWYKLNGQDIEAFLETI